RLHLEWLARKYLSWSLMRLRWRHSRRRPGCRKLLIRGLKLGSCLTLACSHRASMRTRAVARPLPREKERLFLRLALRRLDFVALDHAVLDVDHTMCVFGDVVLVGDEDDGIAFRV